MYLVPETFMTAMKADRREIGAKLVVDYTSPKIDQSVEVATSEQATVSYADQVADGLASATCKWASLDGSWVLDGAYHLAPRPDETNRFQFGWWGVQLAGSGGAFVAPYPALTIHHIPRPIHTLNVAGDSARGEWPVDFSVKLYGPDNTLLHTVTVTDNQDIEWHQTLAAPVLDVAKQILTITKWSEPGRQVKIVEFYTSIQETYYTDDLVEISLLEEREAHQGSLPFGNITANEIAIRIANEGDKFSVSNQQSSLKGLLKPNRRISAWLEVLQGGGQYWVHPAQLIEEPPQDELVPLGVFWSLDWDSPDDAMEAHVKARDRIELLRKSTYETNTVQQSVSLYALAQAVLQDAELEPYEYSIDPALQSIIIPWAWFPPIDHREALRIIAEAGLAVVYADRDGVVRIESMAGDESQPVLDITADDYYPPLMAPSRQDQVANEVVVVTQPLKAAGSAVEVYRSSEPITVPAGQTVTVTARYNQPPVMTATASLDSPPTGVSITGATHYAWGADVAIRNTSGSARDAVLVVSGKPLEVKGGIQVTRRDDVSITENGVLRYEFPTNHLVQTSAQAEAIAAAVLASAKDPRRDIEVEWRGNPALELGDRVTVAGQDVRVIRQELHWAGALSSRLVGRRTTG